MDIVLKIKEELNVEKWQVEAAVKLIDEGNTIPFISRYRKEVTGSLNDEQLRNLDERLKYLRSLEERREQVLASIEEQGKMTDELRAKIVAAETMVAIEDLYLPYRPKRKTRARTKRQLLSRAGSNPQRRPPRRRSRRLRRKPANPASPAPPGIPEKQGRPVRQSHREI